MLTAVEKAAVMTAAVEKVAVMTAQFSIILRSSPFSTPHVQEIYCNISVYNCFFGQ